MAGQQNVSVPTALNSKSLSLSAPPTKTSGKNRPGLKVWYGSDVGISVFTGDGGKAITAIVGLYQFSVLEQSLAVLLKPETANNSFINLELDSKNSNGQQQQRPVHNVTVRLGKDKDGKIYIAILSTDESRPKIPFYFTAPYMSRLTSGGAMGVLSEADISAIYAKAWFAELSEIIALTADSTAKANANGGAMGGSKQDSNDNGNYRKSGHVDPEEAEAEDLPF